MKAGDEVQVRVIKVDVEKNQVHRCLFLSPWGRLVGEAGLVAHTLDGSFSAVLKPILASEG